MNIVILYATVEGQTRKIAQSVASFFEGRGWHVALANVNDMMEFGLERPDAAILLAPVHAGRYPTPFFHFVHQERDWLNSVPSAFVSVCLSIVSDLPEEREEATNYPEALLAETGWTPFSVHNAAGALRFTEYDFFKRWMAHRLSKTISGVEEAPNGDKEFTDWAALEHFCAQFAIECSRRLG
jgi:menaquinone-dependent protoporphyrinogen oxidase